MQLVVTGYFVCIHFLLLFFSDTDMEKFKDKFDDEITHVAMKTGLKKWHVVVALIGKFQDTECHFLFWSHLSEQALILGPLK